MLIYIILLVVLALLLFFAEAFLLPGAGIAGIIATVCVVVADILVYFDYGFWPSALSVLVSIIIVLGFFWWLGNSKTMEKVSLHTTINSTSATTAQLSVKVGDKGKALTRLALIGNAELNGAIVEVKSSGEFLDPGTPVVVVRVLEALVVVEKDTEV